MPVAGDQTYAELEGKVLSLRGTLARLLEAVEAERREPRLYSMNLLRALMLARKELGE